MSGENVTDTNNEEQQASEAAASATAQAATGDEAQAGEKKEGEEKKPDAASEKAPEKTEEEKTRDRENYERRKERKRLRELELENARLKGFKEAVDKGGKTEHEDTAASIEAEYAAAHPEPKEDDFKTWGEFNKAHTRWAVGLARFEDSKTSKAKPEDTGAGDIRKVVQEQRSRGEQEFEDFEEITDDLILPTAMLQTIIESPDGHKLAYYLGQNPKERERISALPPHLQAKELGKIESKIESGTIQLKKPVSKAPAPAPTPGTKGPGSGDISPDMEMDAYAARRTAGVRG